MKIRTDLNQGSEEWLLWRQKNITATDCSVILNKNPFNSPFDLWEEKLLMKPRQEVNKAMLRGQQLEPEAREIACNELGIEFEPACVESSEYPWMVASLDGLSPCLEYILEIKCPNSATHIFAIEGGIHNYYMAQMQHQLCVTGANLCYYMSYNPDYHCKFKILEVLPDKEYIAELIEMEHKFYEENLCQMKEPYRLKYTSRNG